MRNINYLSPLVVALIFLATGCSSNNTLNSSWMYDNQSLLANKKLSQIAIPGTNMANAYGLSGSKKLEVCIGETLPDSLSNNAIIAGQLSSLNNKAYNEAFMDYLNTQTNDIYGQLSNGERYLSLSICTQDSVYYTSNYYLTEPFGEIIKQIKQFMEKNKHEIIILDFDNNLRNSFGYMSDSEINVFHNYIQMNFGSYLTPKQDWKNLTFKQLWSTKHRLIIFSSNPTFARYYDVWGKSEVLGYDGQAKYSTIKKITDIQGAMPELYAAKSNGQMTLLPIYSQFNPDVNNISQLGYSSNDHLVIDYLKTISINTPLNILISDRSYNRLLVNYAVDRNLSK